MSRDLRLKNRCTHQVVEEWLALEADRRTLLPLRNPSSSEIKMLWNRQEVPKEGLFSRIEITSLKPEPYEIEVGDNDTLAFSVSGGSVQTVTLPTGTKVRARTLVAAINAVATGLEARVERGRVVLRLHRAGPDTRLKMEGGNGHATLGFSDLRSYRGRTIIPSWDLVKDTGSFVPLTRRIVFDEPLKSEDDVFELTYFTRREVCRRCQGLGIENDFRHNRQGQPILVQDQKLLLQEVEKIIFTVRGSHVFHRWYGTSIIDMIGTKIIGGGSFVEAKLVSEISNALDRYRQIKTEQARYQPVSDKEFLQRVVAVNVEQDRRDPSIFYVSIRLQSRSGEVEEIEDTLLVSEASLADNFQFLR